MTQFFEIISTLSNPTAILANSEHQKLLQEFERVKESENGWKDCAQLIINDQNSNDQTKFFCMQIIENYLKTRYKTTQSEADQTFLKQFMSNWLQMQVTRKANEKNFLTKKGAQLFALVSLIDFPNRWISFFNDLMATAQWSVGNADFYLKVLLAIDSEIVDRELPRTPEEANLITNYKDSIRKHCMTELVESWYILLKEHSTKNPEITCQALEVIGAYVSWIEINLIVTTRFVEFFSFALGQADLRETTCACLEEIINKGMEINSKLKLIDYLWSDVIHVNAMALDQIINLLNDEQDNCDYLLKFGKLLNAIGFQLFTGWQKKHQKEADIAQLLAQSIEQKLPFALQLLNHSDDDISECVSEYCMHYISILKVNKIQTREQQTYVENMLNVVINKNKYDLSFNFDNEGEDEAMFLEFRKNIKPLFESIAQLDNDFVLAAIKTLVLTTTTNWQLKSFIEIENALYFLYLLGEAIPSSQGNHFTPRSHKSECLSEMIQATITTNLVENPHRIVKFQYFENLARYYRFFQLYPGLLEQVVNHFIGEHGLHNPNPKLRSRVSYLFSRFTRDLKNLLSGFVEKILNSIQDLLIIWSPLQVESPDGLLSSDDQLFLYETVSVLIVTSNLEPKIKAQLMKSLLAPIVGCFSSLLNKYCEITTNEKQKMIYATSLNTAMSVASRVSKGFSNQVKVKDCECTQIFLEILRIFMPAINITTHKSLIHAGVRQYLHRMVICIDAEVLEYVPLTIEHFLKISNEPKDLYDLMPLLNQVISKYKHQISHFIQSILMQYINMILHYVNSLPAEIAPNILKITPHQLQVSNFAFDPNTLNTITNGNNLAASNANQFDPEAELSSDCQLVIDIQTLYKNYFQFLLNIVNNELMEVISTQTPENIFKIYFTLIQGAQIGTSETSKVCFQVIRKFIVVFAEFPNFAQYTIENVVPCCIQLFLRPNVDLNDAQQVLVFNEIGQCLILLYSKFGEDFLKYLEFTYLPTLQLNNELIQGLLEVIKSNNPKGLKTLRESLQPNKKKNLIANTIPTK